jgi:hypothetical protein
LHTFRKVAAPIEVHTSEGVVSVKFLLKDVNPRG